MRRFSTGVLLASVLGLGVHAQGPAPREPLIRKTTVGSELYGFYCASCHGLDAKGRPATSTTHAASADLTSLAVNNGGIFPRDVVRDVIVRGAGKGPSHGPKDMPVWGTIFRALEPSDMMVEVRVDNLVRYIESVQASGEGAGQAR